MQAEAVPADLTPASEHGFQAALEDGNPIGQAGFKGQPSAEGVVEIAYGIDPEHQGRGYATAAAWALIGFAEADPRVLLKCGFLKIGEVLDPEDGTVWRWELRRGIPARRENPISSGPARTP